LDYFNNEIGEKENITYSNNIQVHLDNGLYPVAIMIQVELFETHGRFMKGVMTDCRGYNSSGFVPITFQGMFGNFSFHIENTVHVSSAIMLVFLV
jgi:hypothetical protein